VVVENLPGAGDITRTAAMLKTEQERYACLMAKADIELE